LIDTKGIDGKTTLLHYLCKILEKHFPETEKLKDELANVEPASKVNISVIMMETNDLRTGLKTIQEELTHHKNPSKEDNFLPVMKVESLFFFSLVSFLVLFEHPN